MTSTIKRITVGNSKYALQLSTNVTIIQPEHQTITVQTIYPSNLSGSQSIDVQVPTLNISVKGDSGYSPGYIVVDGVNTKKKVYSVLAHDEITITATDAIKTEKKPLIISIDPNYDSKLDGFDIILNQYVEGTVYYNTIDDVATAKKWNSANPLWLNNAGDASKGASKYYFYSDDLNTSNIVNNIDKSNGCFVFSQSSNNINDDSLPYPDVGTGVKIHISGNLSGLVDVSNNIGYLGGLFARNSSSGIGLMGIDASELDVDDYVNWAVNNDIYYSCKYLFVGSSLFKAPSLNAEKLNTGVYYGMFQNCYLLTDVPSTLPATQGVREIYIYMFAGSTAITSSPSIKLVNLVNNGYEMGSMFTGCAKLTHIECTTNVTRYTSNDSMSTHTPNWTKNINSTGTFVKSAGVVWPQGDNGIPSGWTVIEN